MCNSRAVHLVYFGFFNHELLIQVRHYSKLLVCGRATCVHCVRVPVYMRALVPVDMRLDHFRRQPSQRSRNCLGTAYVGLSTSKLLSCAIFRQLFSDVGSVVSVSWCFLSLLTISQNSALWTLPNAAVEPVVYFCLCIVEYRHFVFIYAVAEYLWIRRTMAMMLVSGDDEHSLILCVRSRPLAECRRCSIGLAAQAWASVLHRAHGHVHVNRKPYTFCSSFHYVDSSKTDVCFGKCWCERNSCFALPCVSLDCVRSCLVVE